MNLRTHFIAGFTLILSGTLHAGFKWTDNEGKSVDLLNDGRPIARYVYEAIDESTPERREETYKPFCHLFQPGSKTDFVTKGPGGKFTHHRGIFYGFSKISYTDNDGNSHENVDGWHCRKACQIHRSFSAQETTDDSAWFTSLIDWQGNDGKVFAKEKRTMRFSYEGKDLIVDFESLLTPAVPSLHLDGDPQHAGFHFRAHNDVNEESQNATYFIRPGSGIGQRGIAINWSAKSDNEMTCDLPWKAMCFTLGKSLFTIGYLDHPQNPKPARASERQYGRFGTFFAADVIPEKPLSVNYRIILRSGEMEAAEMESFNAAFLAEKSN